MSNIDGKNLQSLTFQTHLYFTLSKKQLFLDKIKAMALKYRIKILTEVLNLDDIRVNSYRQHEAIEIILQVELLKKESDCHHCGKKPSITPESSIFGKRFTIKWSSGVSRSKKAHERVSCE